VAVEVKWIAFVFLLAAVGFGAGWLIHPDCPPLPDVSGLQQELTTAQEQQRACALQLSASQGETTALQNGMRECAAETISATTRAMTCEKKLSELNNSNPTWKANSTKYSFTCNSLPLNTPPFDALSKYRCYWDIKEKYGYGNYYTPMQVCQAIGQAGWIESCACVQQMAGDVYAKVGARYYATEYGWVEVGEDGQRIGSD
jgi:hypothetical protein